MGGVVPEEPKTNGVCLSLGNNLKVKEWIRYGLVYIILEHFVQLKVLGFNTVEAYIKQVLTHINRDALEKHEMEDSYFVVTEPSPSQNADKDSMDSLIVTLYNESDHWKIINSWCISEFYIKERNRNHPYPQ